MKLLGNIDMIHLDLSNRHFCERNSGGAVFNYHYQATPGRVFIKMASISSSLSSGFSSSFSSPGSSSSLVGLERYGFKEVEILGDQKLGSGAFGAVCKAKCDRLLCAAKLLHPTFSLQSGSWIAEKFAQECSFLASLRHPHIVQFLGLHTDPNTGSIALLMELMDENLTAFLKRRDDQPLPLRLLLDFAHDVSLAMLYLHNNGIIHRDLSSNNVLLLGERRAKVGDFGMSKLLFDTSSPFLSRTLTLTQVPGCPVYMPPEAWLTPPVYTEKLDVFSLGVLFLQMATGREPNPGVLETLVEDERSPTGFMKLPVSESDRRKDDISFLPLDQPLRAMILQCLEDKQKLRPSTTELCQTLEELKTSDQYRESQKENDKYTDSKDDGIVLSLGDDSIVAEEGSKEEEERDLELKIAQDKVVHFEEQLQALQEQLLKKENEIEELKRARDKEAKKKEELSSSGPKKIDSLSPEVLQVIASNRESRVFNLAYKPSLGQVLFYNPDTEEDVKQSTRVFLQIYQHFFNSGEIRVDFVPVPSSFPTSKMTKLLSVLHSRSQPSCYEYMELSGVIKVVTKSPSVHNSNKSFLINMLNLRRDLGGGRYLVLKKGDITVEEVSIIVSSANGSLQHAWGVSAAINVVSEFEVQKHCDEYTAKYGAVEVGSIACTKAGGSLKCSWIIHAIGPAGLFVKSNEMDAETVKEMKSLTHKILRKAEKLEAQSIAIPAISTGSLMLVPSISANGILEGISSYSFSSSSFLTDIRIIILKESIFLDFVESFLSQETISSSQGKKSKSLRSESQPTPVLDLKSCPDQLVSSSCKQS